MPKTLALGRAAALLLAFLLANGIGIAEVQAQTQKLTERTKQKRAAEDARSEAQKKLAALKRDIERTETAKGRAADALAASEAAISESNRSLRELAHERSETEARLQRLTNEKERLSAHTALQQAQLARLLREQYAAGGEDRLKLLLSGDNPNRITRDLQMLGYVSQAQARLLEALRVNLAAVEANRAAAQNARDELLEIATEAKQEKVRLESEKGRRAALVGQLAGKLSSQRQEASNIVRDEQRLAGLVERLGKLIEEQQKAEAAERERQKKLAEENRRQLAEQAKQAELARQRAATTGSTKTADSKSRNSTNQTAPPRIEPDGAPAKTLARNELLPEPGIQDGVFAALRGKLRLPVKGDLTARFGSKRGDGPAWKGIFIRAAEGSEIKAVAAGRVVFADWLRGFGNMLVIDHGGQYLTIYGNNQTVLKRVGDNVKAGDTIAAAGNTGGNEHSGLYFQLTHQGRAIDPLDWVSLK